MRQGAPPLSPGSDLSWIRLVRRIGGLAKMDRDCVYAANCSVISALTGVLPRKMSATLVGCNSRSRNRYRSERRCGRLTELPA